jgi:Domain of unknown function (DUF4872)/Butirosin biosynthesis protein H, N-terminal
MTDHRSLKKLVRARMERTGERYTTAYRHVTAQAPARAGADARAGARAGVADADRTSTVPPGAAAPRSAESGPPTVPGYRALSPAQHAPSALARSLLGHAGITVTEPLACGLGGGIGFLYAVFEYRDVPVPLLTIVAQHHPEPWLDAVARHLGLALTAVTSSRPGPALAKLDAVLDAGVPAQVVVACGHLPWRDPGTPEEGADPTAVVVAGRVDGQYVVDDGDGELRLLDPDTLATAWSAHRKGRFALTTVDRPAREPDVAAGVRAALRTTHAHLTGPVLGHAFDANLGLRGIRRLADDLADTRTAKGWTRRFGDRPAFAAGMSRLAECLTSSYTAPGATRPLYGDFLAEAGPLTGLDLMAASRTAAAAGERWAEVADVAAAAGPDDDPAAVIARLAELVAATVPVEERLAAELAAALPAE